MNKWWLVFVDANSDISLEEHSTRERAAQSLSDFINDNENNEDTYAFIFYGERYYLTDGKFKYLTNEEKTLTTALFDTPEASSLTIEKSGRIAND